MQKPLGERVTVKDVARLARVSVATVSYVMNRKRFVSPELTRRVPLADPAPGTADGAAAIEGDELAEHRTFRPAAAQVSH